MMNLTICLEQQFSQNKKQQATDPLAPWSVVKLKASNMNFKWSSLGLN